MYINSSFPPDKHYTPEQQKQHWLKEAEDCFTKGYHHLADACKAIAASLS